MKKRLVWGFLIVLALVSFGFGVRNIYLRNAHTCQDCGGHH